MRIAIGILHYRAWPDVRGTLDCVLAQTRQPDRLIVFDHASGDDSAQAIRQAYGAVEVVEALDNRGPAGGMNRMMQELLTGDMDAVMTLPHDAELAPDAVERLAARLEEAPEVGAVGPLVAIRDEPGRVFYAGGYVRRENWSLRFDHVPENVAGWAGAPPRRVDFLELGGILMRATALADAGPLPEHFYYWGDDVDLTLRINASGWGVECVPAAVSWQELSNPPAYIATRNTLGLIARNAPRLILARELVRTVYWLVRDAIRPASGTREDLWPRTRGLVDFCLGRWGPPPAAVASVPKLP